jgi:uncharacterized protein YgiM (DUF1202 family)
MNMERRAGLIVALGVSGTLAACSLPGTSSPTASPTALASASGSASPQATSVGSVRTVLAPLGLNVRSQPSESGAVVGVASQGVTLTVLSTNSDGSWIQVRGQTTTGWISGDASLSAPGLFTAYQSSQLGFAALYPQSWTFAQQQGAVVFRPQQGTTTAVVRIGASTGAFGAPGLAGFVATFSQQEVVCGYTGTLVEYQLAQGSSTPSPPLAGITVRSRYAEIRLRFDASHAMELMYNYDAQSDLAVFADLYNSLTVPYPQCEAAPSAAPSPS